IKQPGLGSSVAWHQDGVTHWDSPNWDQGTHGFNFMAQLYGCTAANGLWVVPGTHKLGRVDIKGMVEAAGTDRLPDAVPMICEPGDVGINNRQVLHGSFANASPDTRVTVNFGFHRRSSVLGVKAGGVHNAEAIYDEARIKERARLIAYAINARQQRFPDETPYVYQPLAHEMENYSWSDAVKPTLRDYNLLDLSI
ncbi:MAG: phytanoyl-CoA dioxygenase family protein, partial [Pseudomonadota bacterium]